MKLQTRVTEVILGRGHENIRATHRSTLEFTKENYVSRNGDCILAVSSDKSLADLSPQFRNTLKKPNAQLSVTIDVDDLSEQILARGDPNLPLSHHSEMVIRKSIFVSDRTLAVCADKAANDVSREMTKKLRNPNQTVKITLTVRA